MKRVGTPDHLFHDGDPSQGVAGTIVDAAWLNQMQEEIAYVIEAVGIVLDAAKTTQLDEAIRLRIARIDRPAQRMFYAMMRK